MGVNQYHAGMCLIALAWRAHPRYPLIVVANRDEFHDRPAAPLAEWPDAPGLYGGRDLRAGGAWLALSGGGRLAAVTNVREPQPAPAGLRSRGALATGFLQGAASAPEAAQGLMDEAGRFGAFNLLLSDGQTLSYASNRPEPRWQPVAPGVHAISNAGLNTPWPKTLRLRAALQAWLDEGREEVEPLFTALADDRAPADAELPDTGVGLDLERLLAPPFIRSARYGTRASSVVLLGPEGWRFEERRFGPDGVALGASALSG